MRRLCPNKRFCRRGHDTYLVGRDTYHNQCLGCKHLLEKDWNSKNPEVWRAKSWKLQGIKNITGADFTCVDYDRLYQAQQGKCAICDRHQSNLKLTLSVDHNHTTGIVRGLLCKGCNYFLGSVENETYKKFLAYLDRNNLPKNTRRAMLEDVLRSVK